MAVVKAGAYGHGLEELAKFLATKDIAFLGVANIGEARRIREAGVHTRIYLLGATWDQEREEIVARNITPCISSLEEARSFNEIAARRSVRLKVHLAVDTGMGRGGFIPDELFAAMTDLHALTSLEIEGIGSHLSSADEDREFTLSQMSSFQEIISRLGGPETFRWRHLSNSAGLLAYENPICNLARPGLMIYGVSPIAEFQRELRNVMTLKSRVTLVRTLPAGHGVSYGRTHITTRPTRVATIGIGYGDGYPRHVSGNGAEVRILEKRLPLIGRVTMDQIMVELPDDSPVTTGDEVEIFGQHISATELANWAGTIPWEIFTGITPRVRRIHIP